MKKKIDEFKIRYPSLRGLASIQYEDPRASKEGKKIFAEKEGQLFADGQVYNGHYVMYNDSKLPGKYIAVHVSSDVNEETGTNHIHAIAIDPNMSRVASRINYRIRASRAAAENKK